MVVWPAGIFHRIISGSEGSISLNFATRTNKFDINNNFNIYDLDRKNGMYHVLKEGEEDQPNFDYIYPNQEIQSLVKDE